jgi:hypothetical protein
MLLLGFIGLGQIFVAVLGASSFTFAQASWTQALPDWIALGSWPIAGRLSQH